jgi:hypothetical protein
MSALPAHISVFTRLPQPGRSKTRLIPALGEAGAATLQREMTEHVVRQALVVRATGGARVEARIADGATAPARRWLGVPCTTQGKGDLGERLERALVAGARRSAVALVVGGDCPTVTAADLRATAAAAKEAGAAIIPAADGGFCALALRADLARSARGLLGGVAWGTERAGAQTLERVHAVCPTVVAMPTRADIDLPKDLPLWRAVRRAWYEPPVSLAVVVPVLDEATALPALIERLAAEGARVVVADGGSTDGCGEVARAAGATVVIGPTGRGAQLNAGAAAATADALLFLHADTRPPDGFARLVLDALADPETSLGAFRFSVDSDAPFMRLVETGTRLRGALLGMPYGDQGLFCRRVLFEALGGFAPYPVMEDYELVRRARRVGRIRVLPQAAPTSDRRWREQGVWRWTALNLATIARYHLGTSPDELAEWRRAHSKR